MSSSQIASGRSRRASGRLRLCTRPARTRIELLVLLAVGLLIVVLAVPAVQRMRRASSRAACLKNLEIIGHALSQYTMQSGGRWPFVAKLPSMEYHAPPWPSLPTVLAPFMRGQEQVFRCPVDARELTSDHPLRKKFSASTTYFETEGTSYEWVLQEVYAGQSVGKDPLSRADGLGLGPADQPVIWEFQPFHASKRNEAGSFNILYADFKARAQRSTTQLIPEKH